MLIIISPAKTLDFNISTPNNKYTIPDHLEKSELLVRELKKKTPEELTTLMKISSKLAMLNYQRFKQWQLPFTEHNAKQAVFIFKGEVYRGLDITRFSNKDLAYAQKHLCILSGLHGVLRPLDLIQPYRLEMGTKFSINNKKNLYDYWQNDISHSIQRTLNEQGDNILINLASAEYFKSIQANYLNVKIITPEFKDYKNGSYKFLSVYGKKARGMMTRFILQNRLNTTDDLKLFEEDGYYYNENLSSENNPVFTRG